MNFFNRLVRGYKSITGREPQGLDLIKIRQEAKAKQIDANKVIEFQQPRSFGEEVDQMIAKGEVNIGTADKTPQYTPSKSQTDFELQEKFRANNEKAIKSFEDRNPNKKPKFYTGGMVDVEPSLDDIGHGADALNARTRLMSPGNQATTSTGLNYLLAEDNDNMRIPFSKGKIATKVAKEVADEGRRGFMKAAGVAGAGIAALKTGLLGFGKEAAPVVEKVAEVAGQAPAYFLNLVQKIKNLGTDVTEVLAYKSRQKVTKYKDYELTEDLTTGRQEIQRMKVLDDADAADYYGQPLTEETYMSFKPGKGQIDETTKGKTPPDEYEEGTALLRSDRGNAGDVVEEIDGVADDVIEEGTKFEDNLSDFGKAEGGRIGFGKGDIVTKGGPALIKAGEGMFTKAQYLIERIKNTIKGSPDDKYVQETFPNFIKELEANPDLAKNENVFKELGGDLPEGQKIVVYGDDTLDFFTESSGPQNIKKIDMFMEKHGLSRDKALEIMKMEPDDQVMELTKTKFLKQKRTDNADGGRIGLFLGGPLIKSGPLIKNQLTQGKSLLKNMLKFLSKDGSHKKSPAEILQMYNPKQFNKLLNNPLNTGKISPATGETADQIIRDTMSKTQNERADMVGGIIDTSRKIKTSDDEIIAYKIKIIKDMIAGGIDEKTARSFAEHMGEQMVRAAGKKVTPKITEQGLLELENIQKNLITKDRKLQATGGLTTMLGE